MCSWKNARVVWGTLFLTDINGIDTDLVWFFPHPELFFRSTHTAVRAPRTLLPASACGRCIGQCILLPYKCAAPWNGLKPRRRISHSCSLSAIDWQEGFAHCNHPGTHVPSLALPGAMPEIKECSKACTDLILIWKWGTYLLPISDGQSMSHGSSCSWQGRPVLPSDYRRRKGQNSHGQSHWVVSNTHTLPLSPCHPNNGVMNNLVYVPHRPPGPLLWTSPRSGISGQVDMYLISLRAPDHSPEWLLPCMLRRHKGAFIPTSCQRLTITSFFNFASQIAVKW